MKMVGGHGIQSFSLVAKISEIHMKISSFRKKICFHYLFIIKTWFLWKIGTLRRICKFSFCFIHISFWILNCSRGKVFFISISIEAFLGFDSRYQVAKLHEILINVLLGTLLIVVGRKTWIWHIWKFEFS